MPATVAVAAAAIVTLLGAGIGHFVAVVDLLVEVRSVGGRVLGREEVLSSRICALVERVRRL